MPVTDKPWWRDPRRLGPPGSVPSSNWRRNLPPFFWVGPLIVPVVAGVWSRTVEAAAVGAVIGLAGLGVAVWVAHYMRPRTRP